MTNIPVIHVCEKTLAAAYEKALIALFQSGIAFQTQYDKQGDPPIPPRRLDRPDQPRAFTGLHAQALHLRHCF